ncbi:MAG TPA: transcriptional regulator [Spirochaetia bacterium]|nr:transcriptional regulator [Spirochaetia bacterium]
MDDLYTRFDSTFFEKTRLSILTIVYRTGVVSFNYLKRQLKMTDGAIYTHLEKLVQGEYLGKKREIADGAAQTSYFMTEKGKTAYRDYLSFLELMLKSHTNHPEGDEHE